MKRIAAFLTAAVFVMTFTACAKAAAKAPPVTSVSAAQSTGQDAMAGTLADKADHWSRKLYQIAVLSLFTSDTHDVINDELAKWGKVLNYTTYSWVTIVGRYNWYLDTIQLMADQGYDGLICSMDADLQPRVFELTQELKIPVIGMPVPFSDEENHIIWPSVREDEYDNGAMCATWLADNYQSYWKQPFDKSKLGCIVIDYSADILTGSRLSGAEDTFKKRFPEAGKNCFVADISADYSEVTTPAIMTAHPEVSKWFIVAGVDTWAVKVTRTIEELKKTDDVLVVSDQAFSFIAQLDNGYTGNVYVAACAIPTAEMAGDSAAGLVAILEGRATPETLWPEHVKPGDKYPCIDLQGTMITKDTYKDWVQKNSFEALSAGLTRK